MQVGFGILYRYSDLSEVFSESTSSAQYKYSGDISWQFVFTHWMVSGYHGGNMFICVFGVHLEKHTVSVEVIHAASQAHQGNYWVAVYSGWPISVTYLSNTTYDVTPP